MWKQPQRWVQRWTAKWCNYRAPVIKAAAWIPEVRWGWKPTSLHLSRGLKAQFSWLAGFHLICQIGINWEQMFTSLPWKPFPALRVKVNGCLECQERKKTHFFHWSVCTLYRPYHHFMNLKRKLAPAPPRSELISPSCGNSDVAMSGDKVTSLRGVLSGGWHCVTTPDAGCFVIFLPDCYSDVFMNGLETKNWTQMTGSQQRWSHNDGFHRVKEGEKQNVALRSSPSEASVSRWAFFFFRTPIRCSDFLFAT